MRPVLQRPILPFSPASNHKRRTNLGLSLLELGMVIVIVSLAMVPIIKMIGGPQGRDPQTGQSIGNATRAIANQSKEILLANSLVEQTLSSDFSSFNCGGTFSPASSLPLNGQGRTFPTSTRCVSNNYNQPFYYQWTVRNMDTTSQLMPTGNHYYQAVLNVWNAPTGGTPLLTLPTSLFWNEAGQNDVTETTGIAIVQDTSGSMTSGAWDDLGSTWVGWPANVDVGSPFLRYRYADPSLGYNPGSISLNINDNSQLDIVSALDTNDSKTDWDDRYFSPGILGVTGCNGASPLWDNTGGHMSHIREICQANGGPNGSAWKDTMDDNMSRLEASRSSLLSFLLSIESDADLYRTTKLGFITFSTGVTDQIVPLEQVDTNNRYPNMRRKFSWFNRIGPGAIASNGATNIYAGVQRAADVLFADPTLGNRIIFLVTDGEPTVGQTSHAAFQNLATKIGNGTYPGANGNSATIFTLGILADSPQMPMYLDNDLASRTPGGQFFQAQTIADVSNMFEQIKYQIQRVILLNSPSRYNVKFD